MQESENGCFGCRIFSYTAAAGAWLTIGLRCGKRGRVVDCTGLENRQRATVREFESHRFRQPAPPCKTALEGPFLLSCRALLQAKLASANDQFTSLSRKVSTNFGRRLR